jgi:hypothetical protein
MSATASCLRQAGGRSAPLEFEPGKEMAAATAANGDEIFVIPLPGPGLAEKAGQTIKEAAAEGHLGLTISGTVDRESIFIAVVGVKGVDGGVPSAANERLARECALRPHSGPGEGEPA